MRIFHAVMRSPNLSDLATSNIWYNNLYLPLVELGHEVVEFHYDMNPLLLHADPAKPGSEEFVRRHRQGLEEQLLLQVRQVHSQKPIDLFFSYFYNSCLTPATIREIRSWGIVTVNFYCNNVHQFHLVSEIAPAYDYCIVPEKVTLQKYQAIGANPIHIQMAANPLIYRPYPLPRKFDVTFVGQRYADRPHIIDYLLCKGINVRVWGPGWLPAASRSATITGGSDKASLLKKVRKGGLRLPFKVLRWLARRPMEQRLRRIAGPWLSDDELVKMYSRSKISLGFSVVIDTVCKGEPNSHLRLRDFEAPMSGALYATGYTEELSEYFEADREVVCYQSKEELADKIRFYFAHPAEAERVRQAGYQRARRDHTWTRRFEQFFQIIGLKSKGQQGQQRSEESFLSHAPR